ncbi:hypothetical protein GE21DRAFT_5279 [Neurospora crassa]|uniref:Uncharacterized protein n=1 Tax=Neurospora crassa (strain ATCC 24698 / 74-OR23-1A / CBS 708.71 / DSM 1257 / FGSC 987) TaxID=367110 RepID=Q7SAU8_NEUCR|nr:hypothetical protein NCU07642 [Neurospora crassa OR74A]EAA33514.3 hypothetical protein NCU07642 [Neurospora crassa OR74A]KHE78665.1 hypothetical protein GE21DRAFT_5279 [Neurospora crassa]|eukprot:XP_962750.3 hypothetical protein NCU07642 [Neurospora crassa OR74A]
MLLLRARYANFPRRDNEKLVLIDELLAAMTNTAGLVDNVGNNPDENGNVKAIRNMTRERQEMLQNTTYEITGTRDNGSTVIEIGNIAEVRDASRNLVKTIIKPLKRSQSDFLDGELPVELSKPKR